MLLIKFSPTLISLPTHAFAIQLAGAPRPAAASSTPWPLYLLLPSQLSVSSVVSLFRSSDFSQDLSLVLRCDAVSLTCFIWTLEHRWQLGSDRLWLICWHLSFSF